MAVVVCVTVGNDVLGTIQPLLCPAQAPDPAAVKLNAFGGDPGPTFVIIG